MDADADDKRFWDAELRRFVPDAVSAFEEALAYACCPICYVLADLPFSYFSILPERWSEEPLLRETVCRAVGFCNHHTWRLAKAQSSSPIATIYADILASQLSSSGSPEPCPLCQLQRLAENALSGVLLDRLAEAEKRAEYRGLFGLCYPHLHLLLTRDCAAETRSALLAAQKERAEALIRLLHEYVAKQRHSRTDAEARSPRWALLKAAGREDL
jgi:hypothetical protein